MFRMILLPAALIAASGYAGTITATTATGTWTIGIPSQSITNGTAYAGYSGGNFISAFNGSACLSSTCTSAFDGFWTASFAFTLPADTTSASLVFSGLQADDRTVLELNGTQIGNGYNLGAGGAAPVAGSMVLTDGGPNNSYSFGGASSEMGAVATGFNIGGSNTLLLIVNNTEAGSYGALNPRGYTEVALTGTVSYTESGNSTAPEPEAVVLTGIGMAAILAIRKAILAIRKKKGGLNMRRMDLRRIGLAGATLASIFAAPSAIASTIVGVDLGTIVIETNVNSSIFNAAYPTSPQTYTYNQLLQNPNNATDGITLDNGKTIDEELTALGYLQNNGMLNYNFPFVLGASGSYSQDGSPSYPALDPGVISLTATSVIGTVCGGANDVGDTIITDPVDAATTYSKILGCESFTNLNNGFPASSTTNFPVNLGTVTNRSTGTVTDYSGEVTVTTWESAGTVDSAAASTPEPSPAWFVAAGLAAMAIFQRSGYFFRFFRTGAAPGSGSENKSSVRSVLNFTESENIS